MEIMSVTSESATWSAPTVVDTRNAMDGVADGPTKIWKA